jgi:hypothetical protein
VNELRVNAPIETFGQGGCDFNVYTGTVILAEFGRVITHADGALGIQISQPIGRLKVRRGIETFGGTGQSLVKGVVMTLSVIGLSIKPGGSAREIEINGGIKTDAPGISPIEQHGAIETFRWVMRGRRPRCIILIESTRRSPTPSRTNAWYSDVSWGRVVSKNDRAMLSR